MTRLFVALALLVALAACDTGLSGDPLENLDPDTQLAIRDVDLTDNVVELPGGGTEERLLSSTISVSWSGSDGDGYVEAFEIRFFNGGACPEGDGPDVPWARTTARDTTVLLPIPPGEPDAEVVFQVRAIDNEGGVDASPACTVFPIVNAPPTLDLVSFELPPDTTFTVFSFSLSAEDPEGEANLAGIDVAFNDTDSFTRLPPGTEFITFVAEVDRDDPSQETAEARVLVGRSQQPTDIWVPGLRLDAENVFYARAVDLTEAASDTLRFPAEGEEDATWYVKKPQSRTLLVNDYRRSEDQSSLVIGYHLDLLTGFLGNEPDVWNIAEPYLTDITGDPIISDLLPRPADPTLGRLLQEWDHIYWVSTSATSSVSGNNFPIAASVLDPFFENGGSMFIRVPANAPVIEEDELANVDNPALLVLPVSDLLVLPDSLRRLELLEDSLVTAQEAVPGAGRMLPTLEMQQSEISFRPYSASGGGVVPLLRGHYRYRTDERSPNFGPWTGPSTVASISDDQQIALWALPLVDPIDGEPILTSPDGDPAAARCAVQLILEGLQFPGSPDACTGF